MGVKNLNGMLILTNSQGSLISNDNKGSNYTGQSVIQHYNSEWTPSGLEGLLLESVLIRIMEHAVNGCGDSLKGKCQELK